VPWPPGGRPGVGAGDALQDLPGGEAVARREARNPPAPADQAAADPWAADQVREARAQSSKASFRGDVSGLACCGTSTPVGSVRLASPPSVGSAPGWSWAQSGAAPSADQMAGKGKHGLASGLRDSPVSLPMPGAGEGRAPAGLGMPNSRPGPCAAEVVRQAMRGRSRQTGLLEAVTQLHGGIQNGWP